MAIFLKKELGEGRSRIYGALKIMKGPCMVAVRTIADHAIIRMQSSDGKFIWKLLIGAILFVHV